MIAGAIVGREP
jgi:hypothetical protein